MEVVPGLEFKRIYWVLGSYVKGMELHYEVRDAPCNGWQSAFIIPGLKRSTIFCPFSFESFSVRNDCGELLGAEEPKEFNEKIIVGIIHENWKQYQKFGFAKDYDTAALVLKKLNATIPEQTMKGGEEDIRKKGGKEVDTSLKKPVPKEGKRGKFLAWFLEKGGSASIREAMAEFGISRSNALSYLWLLTKDHGIGYELVGDNAIIRMPKGCKDPFVAAKGKEKAKSEDDSWLDGESDEPTKETDDSWLDG